MIRIGWIGFHQEGLPALQAVLELGVPVAGVITLNTAAASKRSGVGNYAAICDRFAVPRYEVKNINEGRSVELLRSMDLDVAFVLGWSQILRNEALAAARIGMIGAHASLLPHYRGSAPVNWAILNGERQTGNTLIWLSDEVDAGTMIDQRQFEITPYDTCATVYQRVAESNREMVLAVLPSLLAGDRPGRPQPHVAQKVWPRRRPEDGLIDWCRTSQLVYDFIRGLTRPYPGAFGYLGGRRFTIWRSALLPAGLRGDALPGDVLGSVISPEASSCGQLVACGKGQVIVLEVEDEQGQLLQGRALSEQEWKGNVWSHAA